MEPIIKWAGGKRQLLGELKSRMPASYADYAEPFIGSGALFLDVVPEHAFIGDTNSELINMYLSARDQADRLKQLLSQLEKSYNALPSLEEQSRMFYEKRDEYNAGMKKPALSVEDAALMIFLNKACFNGIYRVNRAGKYNVPFGKHKSISLCLESRIDALSEALKNAAIICGDYQDTCKDLRKGSFIYFDSPYYDTFDTYQPGGFSEAEHRRLADFFKALDEKGMYCMLSNSNTQFIKDLYEGYNIEVVEVRRSINRNGEDRTGKEIIVTNYKRG